MDHTAFRRLDDVADCGVGHHAIRLDVPRTLTFADAAQGLRENPNFDRVDLAVAALDPARGEKIPGPDVRDRAFFHTEDRRIGVERHGHRLALLGLDGEIVAIELFDRAGDPHWRGRGRVLSQGGHREEPDDTHNDKQERSHLSYPPSSKYPLFAR